MDDAQYCPVCFSTLDPSDIEEGGCPICGADLNESVATELENRLDIIWLDLTDAEHRLLNDRKIK